MRGILNPVPYTRYPEAHDLCPTGRPKARPKNAHPHQCDLKATRSVVKKNTALSSCARVVGLFRDTTRRDTTRHDTTRHDARQNERVDVVVVVFVFVAVVAVVIVVFLALDAMSAR